MSKFEEPRIWLLSLGGKRARGVYRNLRRYLQSTFHKYLRVIFILCFIIIMIASVDLTIKVNSLDNTENSWGTGQIFSMVNMSGFLSLLLYKFVSLRGTKDYEWQIPALLLTLFAVYALFSIVFGLPLMSAIFMDLFTGTGGFRPDSYYSRAWDLLIERSGVSESSSWKLCCILISPFLLLMAWFVLFPLIYIVWVGIESLSKMLSRKIEPLTSWCWSLVRESRNFRNSQRAMDERDGWCQWLGIFWIIETPVLFVRGVMRAENAELEEIHDRDYP